MQYLYGILSGILVGLVIYVLRADATKIYNKAKLNYCAELLYLNDIEKRLSDYKKHHEFYKKKNELEKISDMLKKYFKKDEETKLHDIQKKIHDLTEEYENSSPELQTAYFNPPAFTEYFNFLNNVLIRQKNKACKLKKLIC